MPPGSIWITVPSTASQRIDAVQNQVANPVLSAHNLHPSGVQPGSAAAANSFQPVLSKDR
jgi:hypothetical protein